MADATQPRPYSEDAMMRALDAADRAGNFDDAKEIAQIMKDQRAHERMQDTSVGNIKDYKPSGAAVTGAYQFGDQATFGALGYTRALIRSHARGSKYTDELALINEENQADSAENPKSSWAGWGAGMLAGGGALGVTGKVAAKAVAKGAGGLAARGTATLLAPGETVGANIAKGAAQGAIIGGGQAAAEDKSVVSGAGIGAVGGAAGGYIGEKVAGGISALRERFSDPAMRLIAKRTGLTLTELSDAASGYAAKNGGQAPRLIDLLAAHKRGEMQDLMARAPNAANLLNEHAAAKELADATSLGKTVAQINGKPVSTAASLAKEQDAEISGLMNPIRDNTGVLTRAELDMVLKNRKDLGLDKGLAEDPATLALSGRLDVVDRLLADPNVSGVRMTLGDVDTLRQAAGSYAKRHYNSATPGAYDSGVRLRNTMLAAGGRIDATYPDIIAKYAGHARKREGFDVGMSTHTRESAVGAKDSVYSYDGLMSPEGTAGYREGLLAKVADASARRESAHAAADRIVNDSKHGAELYKVLTSSELQQLTTHARYVQENQKALRGITPGRARDPDSGFDPSQLAADAAYGVAGHGLASVYHIKQGIKGVSQGKLSEGVQKRLYELLTNPARVPEAIGIMRRMGASRKDIKNVLRLTGATQSGELGSEFSERNE